MGFRHGTPGTSASELARLTRTARGVARHRAIAVGVIPIGFIRWIIVVGNRELTGLVVFVVAGPVGADELRDAMQVVRRPLVGREQIDAAILMRQIRQAAERIVAAGRRRYFVPAGAIEDNELSYGAY